MTPGRLVTGPYWGIEIDFPIYPIQLPFLSDSSQYGLIAVRKHEIFEFDGCLATLRCNP